MINYYYVFKRVTGTGVGGIKDCLLHKKKGVALR